MSSEEFNELTLRVTSADKKITPTSILDAFSGEFVAEPHPSAVRRSSISFSFDQGERSLSRRNSVRDGLILSPSIDVEDGADPFGKMDIYGARKSSADPVTPSSTSAEGASAGSVSGAIDRRLTIPVFSVTEGYTWKPNQIYASASTPLKKSRDQHLGGGAVGFEEKQLQEKGFFGHVGMWRGWPYDCWTCCNSNARSCKVAAAAAAAKEKKTPAKSKSVTPGAKSAKKSLDESGVLSAFGSREAFPVEEEEKKAKKKKKAVKDNNVKADHQSGHLSRSQSPPKGLSKAKSTLVFIKSPSGEKSESQLTASLASPASNSSSRATRMRSRRGALGTATTSASVDKSEGELAALSALSALSTESGEEEVPRSPPSAGKRRASKSKPASPSSEDFLNLDSAAEEEGNISVSESASASEKKRDKVPSKTDHGSAAAAAAAAVGKGSKVTKAKSTKPAEVVGKVSADSTADSNTAKQKKKKSGKSDADTDAEAASFKSMSLSGIKDAVSRGSKVAAIIVELKLSELPTLASVDDEEADFAREMKLRSAGMVAAKWARMLKKKWLPAKIYLVNYSDGAHVKRRKVGAKPSPAALALLVAAEDGKASPAVMGFVLQQKETLRIVCDETDWINEGLVELKKQQLAQQAATPSSSAPASSMNISNKTPKSTAQRSRSVSTSRSVGASSGKALVSSGRATGGSVERKTSAEAPLTVHSMSSYKTKSVKKVPVTSAVSPKMPISTSRSVSSNRRSSSAVDIGGGDVDLNASMFLSQVWMDAIIMQLITYLLH